MLAAAGLHAGGRNPRCNFSPGLGLGLTGAFVATGSLGTALDGALVVVRVSSTLKNKKNVIHFLFLNIYRIFQVPLNRGSKLNKENMHTHTHIMFNNSRQYSIALM